MIAGADIQLARETTMTRTSPGQKARHIPWDTICRALQRLLELALLVERARRGW